MPEERTIHFCVLVCVFMGINDSPARRKGIVIRTELAQGGRAADHHVLAHSALRGRNMFSIFSERDMSDFKARKIQATVQFAQSWVMAGRVSMVALGGASPVLALIGP